jgi:hypothetical protein
MGKIYRTAQGKNVDIDNLRLNNEDSIAVGNMKVNARGDELGPGGQVALGRNQSMDKFYKMHTPMANNDAQAVEEAQRQAGASIKQGRAAPPLSAVDQEPAPLDQEPAPAAPPLRGSFADSIAREVTVTQDLLTPSNQPKGPTRI